MVKTTFLRIYSILLLIAPAFGAGPPAEPQPHWKDEIESMLRSLPPGAPDLANVADPDASGGRAVEAGPRVGAGNSWHNYRTLQPGDYRATFRLKVADNTSPQVVFDLIVENGNAQRTVRANEFAAPGKYQDFDVPFRITRPTLVSTPTRSPIGKIVGWADCVTITLLHRYGDREQLQLLGCKPAQFTLPASATGVLLAHGLYHEFWHADEALADLGPQATCVVRSRGDEASLRGFPDSLDALGRFRLVVLADVPAAALVVEQRAMLEAYVHGGGGLLALGGPYTFGLGDWNTSDILAELVPAVLDRHYDLIKCQPPSRLQLARAWLPPGQEVMQQQAAMPVIVFRHQLRAKPGAEVMATAGSDPLLIGRSAGRGRVVAVLATPLGDAPAGETAWWNWSGWPALMQRAGQWAINHN